MLDVVRVWRACAVGLAAGAWFGCGGVGQDGDRADAGADAGGDPADAGPTCAAPIVPEPFGDLGERPAGVVEDVDYFNFEFGLPGAPAIEKVVIVVRKGPNPPSADRPPRFLFGDGAATPLDCDLAGVAACGRFVVPEAAESGAYVLGLGLLELDFAATPGAGDSSSCRTFDGDDLGCTDNGCLFYSCSGTCNDGATSACEAGCWEACGPRGALIGATFFDPDEPACAVAIERVTFE
jgi:hypothetical protein